MDYGNCRNLIEIDCDEKLGGFICACPSGLSMVIYMVMGWLAIFIFPTLIKETQPIFIILIALGGVMYTMGTFFYSKPQKRYFHFVWHIFIILASICHLLAILYFM